MKNYKFLSVITGLFTGVLVVTNILNAKIFHLGSIFLPAGIITFPLAFVFGDILTEVYGYASTRKVIWTGFTALIFMAAAIEMGRILPSAPFWQGQSAYETILGQVPRVVLASMVAYFAGEFCNSYVLAKIKVRLSGRSTALRFVYSTIAGQAVDTIFFVTIAFIGSVSGSELFNLMIYVWIFKVLWEVVALPITLPVVNWLKKVENEDYYDRNTNFNPFHI